MKEELRKILFSASGGISNMANEEIDAIINLVDKELENLKIAKLNLDKFTTDHADGYQMAVEDMNRHINDRIKELKK